MATHTTQRPYELVYTFSLSRHDRWSDQFTSFLGYNPLQSLLGSQATTHVTSVQWATHTGKHFFPHLMQLPFHDGLVIVFALAIAMSVIGALFSSLRGSRCVHEEHTMHKHIRDMTLSDGAVPGELAIESDVFQ